MKSCDIKQIKDLFLEICKIDNPPGHEDKIVEFVVSFLNNLKINVQVDNRKNIFFKIPGKGESLLLNAHLDGVQPCEGKHPKFDGEHFYSKGDTILGADDLTGVVCILKVVELIKTKRLQTRPLEILFTTMEEIGGVGIKNFDFSEVKSKEGVTLDSLAPVGTVVIKSPTKYNFTINFQGRAIHGQGADKGISAIKIMADLLHILPLGKVKKNIFLNIGVLNGGKSLNTVPGEASVEGSFKIESEGEIRSEKREEITKLLDLIHSKIIKVKKKYHGADIMFNSILNRPGYSFSLHDDFIKIINKAIKKSNIIPKPKKSFGVSDANTLNAMGIKTVLIGTGVKNAHTTNETVTLKDLVKLTEITANIVKNQDKKQESKKQTNIKNPKN